MAALLCALLLAPGLLACRSNDAPAADDPVSEQAEGETSDETAVDADDAENAEADAADPDEAADAGDGADEEGEPLDEPTPDATVVALAQSFEPPIKGDPNAPVMIYEFSDFL
jgi:protein-disulfide isomerase